LGFLLHRPESADLVIDGDQFGTEVLKPMELFNLPLGLAKSSRRGKALGHSLALDLSGETELRSMAGVLGDSTMTGGLATASYDGGYRPRTQITQLLELLQ
jgi:hypothetical protein